MLHFFSRLSPFLSLFLSLSFSVGGFFCFAGIVMEGQSSPPSRRQYQAAEPAAVPADAADVGVFRHFANKWLDALFAASAASAAFFAD